MHRNYAQSIEAFQVALRAEPEDQLLWLRLGEAYSKAGRHAAALKALTKAHELDPNDWICTFLIGEVQHQTGRLVEALLSFNSILDARPKEIGVLLSLAQTQLDLAHQERFTGFGARSEQSFVAAITTCFTTSQESPGHGGVTWKLVADALFGLSKAAVFVDERSVEDIVRRTNSLLQGHASTRIAQFFSPQSKHAPLMRRHVLEAAVVAYDYRITVGSTEDIGLGSALFDLAVALYAWCAEDKSSVHGAVSESATSLLKQALQKEPGNPVYWTALGNMYFLGKPKAAQHAYIKALEHDSKVCSMYALSYRGLEIVSDRVWLHGPTWVFCTYTTTIWNWQTRRYYEHRYWTLIILLLGLGKRWWLRQMDMTPTLVDYWNMQLVSALMWCVECASYIHARS